ncbi:MAG: RidA family protein [Armatimonadetes bacterium]|nr:RidA family protein [Armatimonadota bacterium]
MQILLPPGWPRPKGYSNGIVAEGRLVFVSGQIGWDENERIVSDDFVAQFHQTLSNIVKVLAEAGASPADIARMTWFITDKQEYLDNIAQVGAAYREIIGPHYPTMSVVVVKALLEDAAKVEIETTAVVASK